MSIFESGPRDYEKQAENLAAKREVDVNLGKENLPSPERVIETSQQILEDEKREIGKLLIAGKALLNAGSASGVAVAAMVALEFAGLSHHPGGAQEVLKYTSDVMMGIGGGMALVGVYGGVKLEKAKRRLMEFRKKWGISEKETNNPPVEK